MGLAEWRDNQLGNKLALLQIDGECITKEGKVNWARVGLFRPFVDPDTKFVKYITHLFSGIQANIEAEQITQDFHFDNNWSSKSAQVVKGSRKHMVLDFFTADQKKQMGSWAGSCRDLNDQVGFIALKVEEAKQASSSMEVAKEELMQETKDARAAAIALTKQRLIEAKEQQNKKRRVSLSDAQKVT